MQTKTTSDEALHEVVRWRREQLVGSDFSLPLAAEITENPSHDLNALIELVERGCRPDLAVRILAPAQEDSAA